MVMMSFFPQNFSKASHVTATSRQRLGFSAQHLWNRTSQGCQFPFLLLPLACPSPLVRAFILWWTQAPPGIGTLVLEVRDHFLDISLTSELQPGKHFGSRWGWGSGVSQIHQRTENGVERHCHTESVTVAVSEILAEIINTLTCLFQVLLFQSNY